MFIGGYGFIAGATGGGGGGGSASITQYRVGKGAGNPTNGSSTFILPQPVLGNTCFVSVSGPQNFLEDGVQILVRFFGGYVTQIDLLGGLLFNTGEIYTIFVNTQ